MKEVKRSYSKVHKCAAISFRLIFRLPVFFLWREITAFLKSSSVRVHPALPFSSLLLVNSQSVNQSVFCAVFQADYVPVMKIRNSK